MLPFWLTLTRFDGEDPVSSFRRFAEFGEGIVRLALRWALVESARTCLGGGRVAAGIVKGGYGLCWAGQPEVTFLRCISGGRVIKRVGVYCVTFAR